MLFALNAERFSGWRVTLLTTKTVSASKTRRGHPQTNPNSLANLIPYKKGQNGNPKPGNSLKASLLNALLEPLTKPPEDAPVRDRIVYATLKGAIDCEPTFAHLKEVWDRVEGKLTDQPPANPSSQILNIIVVGGNQNLHDVLLLVKERTKQLTMGSG